jgi:hypothetical protein
MAGTAKEGSASIEVAANTSLVLSLHADLRDVERPHRLRRTPTGRNMRDHFRVQTSSSHTISHPQSHVGAPITGSSAPHRRHPFVMT